MSSCLLEAPRLSVGCLRLAPLSLYDEFHVGPGASNELLIGPYALSEFQWLGSVGLLGS